VDKATAIKQRAQALINRGAHSEAMAEYEKLLSLDIVNPYAYILLGDLAARMGNRTEALKRYGEATEAYETQGLFRNAIAVLKKMLRIDSSEFATLRRLADLYASEGLVTEAVSHYLDYGTRCLKAEQEDDTREVLEIVTKLGSPNARVAMKVADLCKAVGETERAALELLRAAKDLEKRGLNDRAEELRAQAAEIDPKAEVADTTLDLGGYELTLDPGVLEPLDMAEASSAGRASGADAAKEVDLERTTLDLDSSSAAARNVESLARPDTADEAPDSDSPKMTVLPGLERRGGLFDAQSDPPAESQGEPDRPRDMESSDGEAEDLPEISLDLGSETTAESAPAGEETPVGESAAVEEDAVAEPDATSRDETWTMRLEICVREGDRTGAEAIIRQVATQAEEDGNLLEAERAYTRLWELGRREEEVAETLRRLAVLTGDKKGEARWASELGELALIAGDWETARERFQKALDIDPEEPLARRRSERFQDIVEEEIGEGPSTEGAPAADPVSEAGLVAGPALDGVSGLSAITGGNGSAEGSSGGSTLEEPATQAPAVAESAPSQSHEDTPPTEAPQAEAPATSVEEESTPVADSVADDGNEDRVEELGEQGASRVVDLFREQIGSQIGDQDHASHYDLGMTYMEMDLVTEAIAEFRQALGGEDYRRRCLELLATCYSRTGEPAQAATHWRAAIAEAGDAVEEMALRYELACALTEAGQVDEAREELQEVLRRDPAFLDAQERLTALGA
jgi:tetratricopeptide (TPR) repeat protein